jgi:alpha-mannosidase
MLTRQLRYTSYLDEVSFRSSVLAAAADALAGDADAARRNIQSACDRLHDSRQYYYPVEAHLLDLTLLAPTTIGAALREQLAGPMHNNLLVAAAVIEEMAQREPDTLAALKAALEKGTANIIGGELTEDELPLLPPEAIRARLERGLAVYQQHLGVRPVVFGRRRFGLTPRLPQILTALGFTGAIHCTLDDGRFPTGNQSRLQWEGLDGTTIETLARVPIDIAQADAFLRLPEKLGSTMDLDQVATAVLAHWPGQISPWLDDLRRITSYTTAVGAFETMADYFSRTAYSGQRAHYSADQYRSPYLQQAVAAGQPDPISRWVRYYTRRAVVEAAQSLDLLTAACGLAARESDALEQSIQRRLDETLQRFGQSLHGKKEVVDRGYLLVNPCSFSRRMCVELPELRRLPDVAGFVRAAGESNGRKAVVLDVPAMGFAWVGPGSVTAEAKPAERKGLFFKKKPPKEPTVVEETTLSNEFFNVAIDPTTGAIRSISTFNTRGPRLAQQIAMRLSEGGGDEAQQDAQYSTMVAEEVAVTANGSVLGEIRCRGRLVDCRSQRLAGYVQTTRVWRGSRIIEIDIELDVAQSPGPNPWQSYYAARFAWGDPTSDLFRSVNMAVSATDTERLESPHFVDVRVDERRTTLVCGGLPYHRRLGLRMMDTLLVVQGETARQFRLGVGIDLPNPMPAALGWLAPPTVLPGMAPPPASSGWLFHLDSRNVVATSWEPIATDGRLDGFRVRLLETEGVNTQLSLRTFRPAKSAQRIATGDNQPTDLTVDGDRIVVDLSPHAWAEVVARF